MSYSDEPLSLGPPPTPYQIARAEQDIIDSRRREAWEAEQRRKLACRWCGTRGDEFCNDVCRARWRQWERDHDPERDDGAA
jgi:hypothetical protein